jgi:hypothetical protein
VLSSPVASTANETMTSATVSSTLDVSPLREGAEQPETDHEDDQRPRVVLQPPVIPALDTQTSTR